MLFAVNIYECVRGRHDEVDNKTTHSVLTCLVALPLQQRVPMSEKVYFITKCVGSVSVCVCVCM